MRYKFMTKPDWLLHDFIFSLADKYKEKKYSWLNYLWIMPSGEAYPRNRFYTGRRIGGMPEYV